MHEYLRKQGIKNPDGEWFVCAKSEVESAIKAVRDGKSYELSRDRWGAWQSSGLHPYEKSVIFWHNRMI